MHNLLEEANDIVPAGIARTYPILVKKALNAEVWCEQGKRYIDFIAGIAVLNTGHAHPKVIEAVKQQLDAFTHTAFQVLPYRVYLELCKRLNQLAPGKVPYKSMLINAGAEAVENAVKIARIATGRPAVIAFQGGFHGRTNMTLGLTGKVKPYKLGCAPFPNEIYHAVFPSAFHGISVDEALQSIKALFTYDVSPERVAAFLIEPVQGEGGYIPADFVFLQKLKAIAQEHSILLIVDEIQSGIARTGKLFAIEYSGVEPDLLTSAKGLGGGFPISAVIGKAEIMDATKPGALGGTFAGNPLSCAASLAVLDIIEQEKLCERAQHIGQKIVAASKQLSTQYPIIANVRGLGAMVGVEFCYDGDAKKPACDVVSRITQEAFKRGLLMSSCGTQGNIIRFMPPLTIEDAVLDEALAIFADTVKAVC